MNEKLIGQAKLDLLGNDLSWKLCFYDDCMNWVKLRWNGYNDAAWWNKCSKGCDTVKGSNGKSYRIDFSNCNVYEVVE